MENVFASTEKLREMELENLVRRGLGGNDPSCYNQARKLMHKFYDLCKLSERNMIRTNSERYRGKWYTKKLERKEAKIFHRLNKVFHDHYGLNLYYLGYMPAIGEYNPDMGFYSERIKRYF